MRRFVSIVMILAIAASLCACGAKEAVPETPAATQSPEPAALWEIVCVDEDGGKAEHVKLQVCSGDSCRIVETDSEGRAEIEPAADGAVLEVSIAELPDSFRVTEEKEIKLSPSSTKAEIRLHRLTSEETEAEASAPEISEFEPLVFSSTDETGSTVDSSVFGNYDITVVKLYLYDESVWDGICGQDVINAAEVCSKYGDRVNMLIVPGQYDTVESGKVVPMKKEELNRLKSASGTGFPFLAWTDDFTPFADCYYVNTLFVNREGNVVKPVYEKYDEEDRQELQDLLDMGAKDVFKDFFVRSGECLLESTEPTLLEMYVTALLGDNMQRWQLESWLNDFSKIGVDTVTSSGEKADSSILDGYRVTMINMWEPWCGPCKGELPSLQKLNDKYKEEGFQVIGVYSDEEGLEQVLEQNKITYTNLRSWRDTDKFATGSVPTTLFVDSEGNILSHEVTDDMRRGSGDVSDEILSAVYIGSRDYNTWEKIILDLLEGR